jgi:hypothetical protein
MVCSWSSVASLEDDEEVTVEASSQEKAQAQQHDVTQQQDVASKADAQRQRGKRARSVDLSSSNPSASASRKSVAWKHFKVILHFHQKLLMLLLTYLRCHKKN